MKLLAFTRAVAERDPSAPISVHQPPWNYKRGQTFYINPAYITSVHPHWERGGAASEKPGCIISTTEFENDETTDYHVMEDIDRVVSRINGALNGRA